MILKAVITYDDGTEATFSGTVATPAVALDLTTIPLQSPTEIAAIPPAPVEPATPEATS